MSIRFRCFWLQQWIFEKLVFRQNIKNLINNKGGKMQLVDKLLIVIVALLSNIAYAANYNVSNSNQLLNTMRMAKGGDVINLAGGTYSNLIVRHSDRNPLKYSSSGVIIRSANSQNPAIFNRLEVIGIQNATFQDIRFIYSATRSGLSSKMKPFRLESGKNVTYKNISFEGYNNNDGIGQGYGFSFKTSDNVRLENCSFDKLYYGLQLLTSTNVALVNNRFTNIGWDAIQIGTTQNLLIDSNYIQMKTVPNQLHKDMIQIHNAGPGLPTANVIIRNNTLYAPNNGNNCHSMYFGNERAQQGRSMYYRNFTIENNDIQSGQSHGISVGEIIGVTIRNNNVRKHSSVTGTHQVYYPIIKVVRDSSDVTVTGNTIHKAPVSAQNDGPWTPLTVPNSWTITPNNVIGFN